METTNEIMNMFIMLFCVIGIESLIIIFIVWKTPAMTFLKASLLKRPVLYIMGKDRLGKFRTFKSEHGTAQVGKDGLYHLTENSHTLEAGSKIPLYFAFVDLAATLLPEYPAIIQELREDGLIINNLEDINNYMFNIKKGMQRNLPISVKAYKTYKLHDLENMFPNNLDPTFIDSTVQCQVSRWLKIQKAAPLMMAGLAMLIVVTGLTIYIVQRSFKGCISPNECEQMVAAAKCTFNTIQAINTTAILG